MFNVFDHAGDRQGGEPVTGGDRHTRLGLPQQPSLSRDRWDQGAQADHPGCTMLGVIENLDDRIPGLGKSLEHFFGGVGDRHQLAPQQAIIDRHLDGPQNRARGLDDLDAVGGQPPHQGKRPPPVGDRAGMDHEQEIERAIVFRAERLDRGRQGVPLPPARKHHGIRSLIA
jgi:hypothetical protein